MAVYHCKGLIGSTINDLANLGINATNGPATQTINLTDGDFAVYSSGSEAWLYYFDADGEDAESSPQIIRPNDYDTEGPGVWKRQEYNELDVKVGIETFTALEMEDSNQVITIAFTENFADTDYVPTFSLITSDAEGDVVEYGMTVFAQTVSGFKIKLSGVIETDNYKLGWKATHI